MLTHSSPRLATLIEIIQPEEGDSETPCVLKFECPSRGLIGFRSALTHLSRGTATLDYLYLEHRHFLGPLTGIEHGSLISMHDGKATAYAIAGLESRGTIFIKPQVSYRDDWRGGNRGKTKTNKTNMLIDFSFHFLL